MQKADIGDFRSDGALLTADGWRTHGEYYIHKSKLPDAKAFGWTEKQGYASTLNLVLVEKKFWELNDKPGRIDPHKLRNLGKQTPHKLSGADATLLEAVSNPMSETGTAAIIKLETDEFTSVCPATGGPDFGTITITYSPINWIIESKSLKYYFESFRNEPIFHEAAVAKICADLGGLLEPHYLYVDGNFKARGGITIKPHCEWWPS